MSVPEQVPYKEYRATGSNNSFEITFCLPDPKDLVVMVNKEIPLVGAYSIVGDSVVFSTPPNEGDLVELTRDTQLDRETNFKSYDNSFRPETINFDLDKIWLVLQESNLVDAKILARLKQEIEWRRIHDFNYDELAQVREKQLFDALKSYTDTLNAATNPSVFQGVIAGVVFARDGKSIQTHLEDIANQFAEERQYIEDHLDLKANESDVYLKNQTYTQIEIDNLLDPKADQAYVDATFTSFAGGRKGFTTLALAQAAQSTLPADTVVDVTNDPTASNNGTYQWNGTTLTKSAYDPLTQAKNYTNSKLSESVYTPGFKPIEGIITVNDYIIDTIQNNPIYKPYPDGQYIKIPVKAGDQIKIEGSRNEPSWKLCYINALGNKISISENYGDGLYIVPAGAVFALKTVKSTASENTATSYLVYDALANNRIDLLNESLDEVDEKIENLKGGDPYIELVLEPIVGAAVTTNSSIPDLLATGVDRSYLQLDVSEFTRIEIKNARTDIPQWVWVFADSQLSRLTISTKYGNGSLTIPSGAKYALRTLEAIGNTENSNLEITGFKSALSVQAVYQELKTDIDTLKNSPSLVGGSSSFGAMADMMSMMFSQGNVLKISEFSAATQHDQIENAIRFIKKRGWGILDMESGVWLRNSAVLLPDNCWIYLNEATVKLADGVFDNVFRNEGIVPNPDPFEYALELNENRNIRIFGKSKDLAKVSGPDVPYTAPHPTEGGDPIPWVGDFYGWRTLPVLLANVKDYKLHDFGMVKTTCWAISQEHGCENFEVFNIKFDTSVKNGDGVDIRQGCKKGKIYNISGKTGDDMVALSAIQNFIVQHPSGNYVYPMQVGGYGDRGFGGNIEDVQINSISGRGLHNCVRLLASGGSKLNKISVDNISDKDGSFNAALVLVSSGYGAQAQMGDMTNITVNGIESNFSQTPLRLSGSIQDSAFNKIRQHKSAGVLYDNTALLENSEITNAEFVV